MGDVCLSYALIVVLFDGDRRRPSCSFYFFVMIRRPPRSTLDRSSAASDVYKRQAGEQGRRGLVQRDRWRGGIEVADERAQGPAADLQLSLIHISEPTRPY